MNKINFRPAHNHDEHGCNNPRDDHHGHHQHNTDHHHEEVERLNGKFACQ